MKIIKYNLATILENGEVLLTPVSMGWNEANENIAKKEAYNGEYTIEEHEDAATEIAELKGKLRETDYHAIKYAEGALTIAEYADMREQRQAWRDRINELEVKL